MSIEAIKKRGFSLSLCELFIIIISVFIVFVVVVDYDY